MARPDLVVVGGGVMGLATAWAAASRGASVHLVDPRPTLNDHNASNDESKIFRFAYRGDVDAVRLAQRALDGWRRLERETGRRVLHLEGLAMLPGAFERESAATLERLGLPVVRLDAREARARFPAFADVDGLTIDPNAGWLDPPALLQALHDAAVARGARIERGVRARRVSEDGAVDLDDGRRLEAGAVVVAAGFHTPELVPDLAARLRVTRQVELFFDAPAGLATPVFAALEEGFYGFPPMRGAIKVADHRQGPVVADLDERPPPTPEEVETARAWLRRRIPALAERPVVRHRVCLYDNSPDERFILERRGRVVVACGFSGHGIKFAPAVGEDLVTMALR